MKSAAILLLGFLLLAPVRAEEPAEKPAEEKLLEVGADAPDFELLNEKGKPVRLSSFEGKKAVVLAFYPMDFTGG